MLQNLISITYYLLIIFLYCITILRFSLRCPELNFKLLVMLMIYHIIFQIIYWKFSLSGNLSDPIMYFNTASDPMLFRHWFETFGVGTKFIQFLIYPFVSPYGLNLSYFEITFIFGYIGFLGFVEFYLLLKRQFELVFKGFYILILFLPNLHFWTVSLGKDSLFFYFIIKLLSLIAINKISYVRIFVLFFFLFFVRFYIGLSAIISLSIVFFLFMNKSFFHKIISGSIFMIIAFFLFQYVIDFIVKINVSDLEEYLTGRQEFNQNGGSSLDISNYNIFQKYFTFLFRPLFLDTKLNLLWIISSFENLAYLFLTLKLVNINFVKYLLSQSSLFFKFNLIYFVISLSLLAYTVSNLGLAMRQKTMVIPSLIILVFGLLNYKKISVSIYEE